MRILKYPAAASLSFVMEHFNTGLPAIRQYPNLELHHWYALSAGMPSFLKLATFVLGFFHCFQMYIRNLRRIHSSQDISVRFLLPSA